MAIEHVMFTIIIDDLKVTSCDDRLTDRQNDNQSTYSPHTSMGRPIMHGNGNSNLSPCLVHTHPLSVGEPGPTFNGYSV